MHKLIFITLFLSMAVGLNAATIRGKATDANTGELLVGCTIYVGELKVAAISGLDGSFLLKNIPVGKYTISCTLISYGTINREITVKSDKDNLMVEFSLEPVSVNLDEVTVTSKREKSTELSARVSEKNANQVISVVSAKSIELSPDITVASVIGRVSGVTLERSASGEGQYAILRGMDKRFNYTMVNGVKIPSPDNKNRFVPLDIFPSELLDRLEVSKSLTANMEGDGIGGAVNMIMKDAPTRTQFTVNLSTGYNSHFFNNDFQSYDFSGIKAKSPSERYGLAYPVQMKDFTTKNLHMDNGKAKPNLIGGFSAGDRFFKDVLGVMFAGSYQSTARGNISDLFSTSSSNDGLQQINHRFFSTQQTRMGLHSKFDVKISPNHKLIWYNAYMDFSNAQVRDAISSNSQVTRLRWNRQTIMSSTLKGTHRLLKSKLDVDWALSYGKAMNQTPDNIQIDALIINGYTSIDQNEGASRRWEHNSDKDLTGNANITYKIKLSDAGTLELSTGGLYRDKVRESFFNEYHFKPYDPAKANPREIIKGVDYNNFDEIKFSVNSFGNLSDPLNYKATEKIGAGYLMEKLTLKRLQFIAGVRAEHTNQGYYLKFTTEGARNEGYQKYVDVLPSANLKYPVHRNANLRFSYFKGLNRPSFFEIVPYSIINEDYKERGNPDLKHTVADNFDFRYEYFPHPLEQIMVGVFYKSIKDPVEFGMMNGFGQDIFYMPMNFGNAHNYGVELDIIKYFKWFGVKANYTFTNSDITTTKIKEIENPDPNAETKIITQHVNQTRPLFGQAGHVANISFLLKDMKSGWDAQVAFTYTGDRIVIVSRYLDEDTWQAGYISMDASIEKKFHKGLILFAKGTNLLNSPMMQYIRQNDKNALYVNVKRYKEGVVDRQELYGLNISIGLKYKFQ